MPTRTDKLAEQSRRLSDVLTPAQRELLAMVLVQGLTQHVIAAALGRPQTTIASRIVEIRRRLQAAGLPVPLPPRGRRRSRINLIGVEPAVLARLTVGHDESGTTVGRWVGAHDGKRARE